MARGGNFGRRALAVRQPDKRLAASPFPRGSAERCVAVDVPDRTGQAELRQDQLVSSMQHLRAPALAGSEVDDDLDAVLTNERNASAGWMRAIDLSRAFDNVLV